MNQLHTSISSSLCHMHLKNKGGEVGKNLPSGEDPLLLELDEASETLPMKLGALLETNMKLSEWCNRAQK